MKTEITKIIKENNQIYAIFMTEFGKRKTLINKNILKYNKVKTIKKGDILDVVMSMIPSKNNKLKNIEVYKIVGIENVEK